MDPASALQKLVSSENELRNFKGEDPQGEDLHEFWNLQFF